VTCLYFMMERFCGDMHESTVEYSNRMMIIRLIMCNVLISYTGITRAWSFRSVAESDHHIVFVKVRETPFGPSCRGRVVIKSILKKPCIRLPSILYSHALTHSPTHSLNYLLTYFFFLSFILTYCTYLPGYYFKVVNNQYILLSFQFIIFSTSYQLIVLNFSTCKM
jgi:hypothetical protein